MIGLSAMSLGGYERLQFDQPRTPGTHRSPQTGNSFRPAGKVKITQFLTAGIWQYVIKLCRRYIYNASRPVCRSVFPCEEELLGHSVSTYNQGRHLPKSQHTGRQAL